MPSQIEIEIKSLLTESSYLKLLKYFYKNMNDSYIQINYYIDTPNLDILKNKDGLRIRKKNKYELTFKTPNIEGLIEVNQDINFDDFNNFKENNIFPDGEIKNYIESKYNVSTLKILSTLTTYRIDIEYKNGLISIDKNIYNNNLDYELEYETNSYQNGLEILKELFKELDIEFKENKKSKLVRAMDQYLNK